MGNGKRQEDETPRHEDTKKSFYQEPSL